MLVVILSIFAAGSAYVALSIDDFSAVSGWGLAQPTLFYLGKGIFLAAVVIGIAGLAIRLSTGSPGSSRRASRFQYVAAATVFFLLACAAACQAVQIRQMYRDYDQLESGWNLASWTISSLVEALFFAGVLAGLGFLLASGSVRQLKQVAANFPASGDRQQGKSFDCICPDCSVSVTEDWKFCPDCGRQLVAYSCSECGKDVMDEWEVCPHCGQSLEESQ
jgi:RNA polymerase subunit RPABC4/transcription elongation factor Spt4